MNRSCHEQFQRARVRCNGLTLDLVAPLDDERPGKVFEPGAIVEGSFYLLGTVDPAHHDYTMPLIRGRAPTPG